MIIKDDETAEKLRVALVEFYEKRKIYNDFSEKLKQLLKSLDNVIFLERSKPSNFDSINQDICERLGNIIIDSGIGERVKVDFADSIRINIKQ